MGLKRFFRSLKIRGKRSSPKKKRPASMVERVSVADNTPAKTEKINQAPVNHLQPSPCGASQKSGKLANQKSATAVSADRSRMARKAEDTVEYSLFPAIPENISTSKYASYLEEQLDTFLAHVSNYLVDYIWQNEPFQLRVGTGAGPPHLHGSTCYGDYVEDEWFIVYLMYELTKAFPGLVAKVSDCDGEFLLIEAAESLPKWVKPEAAEGRVFIYEGKLHLIPVPQTPGQVALFPVTPEVEASVTCVRNPAAETGASSRVQRDIQNRIKEYPEKMHESFHRTHAYIPAPLAAVLDHSPTLVAPMVQAFYLRDPIDLKACVTMKHFRPGTRVMREVKMTKCLYAQVLHQRFTPDKRSGWNVPPTSNPNFKAHDIGMKLAHGAEILCSKCGNVTPGSTADPEEASKNDPRWQRYVVALTDKGYFRGQLEGSKLYRKLLDDARKYFCSTVVTDNQNSPDAGSQMLGILGNIAYDIEDMRRQEQSLKPPDEDSWLDINPSQLDAMLNKVSKGHGDSSQVRQTMQGFIENVSSHEGAEFPKDRPMSITSEDGSVQFDSGGIIHSMQKMFDFDDPSGSDSDDMDEYASDDDMEEYSGPKKGKAMNNGKSGLDDFLGMKEYMDEMDKELAPTTMGKSFVTQEKPKPPQRPPRKKKSSTSSASSSGANNPSASRQPPRAAIDEDDLDDLEDDDFRPVNVDLNVVKNMMDSYQAQAGEAGPVSNILGSMGVAGTNKNTQV